MHIMFDMYGSLQGEMAAMLQKYNCDVIMHMRLIFFLYYRYLHEPNSPKKKITRKREFEDSIREENIEMPTQLPPEVERKSIQERIQV